MTNDQKALLDWYSQNKRELPWRGKQDPYAVWISEVMLQQTTVTAVIPFYERFLRRFPSVADLAQAKEAEVLALWAGLGYYSRARMLHRSAKEIRRSGFPKTYQGLLKLPGFGPYTARAVASLAFGEAVGAVDGNVIRVLSRRHGLRLDWWTVRGREKLQEVADELVQKVSSSDVNQALMDLGSSLCSSKSPTCVLCPWMRSCEANKLGTVEKLPKTKPRRSREVWIWRPSLLKSREKFFLIRNNYAPFLKGQWLPPGTASKTKTAPKRFLFRHSITHHDIFVIPRRTAVKFQEPGRWVGADRIAAINPTNLVKKLLERK